MCFSIHCINKMSVDLTHYSLPLVQIHTPDVYISGVLWTAGTGRGQTWPSLSNVPCTTSTHITSINVSGGQQHRVCWSCVSGPEVVLISSGVDVFLSAEKLNSSSEDQETNNTLITRLLNELLPVHPPTHHLVHHIGLGLTDTHNLANKAN